MQPDPVPNHLLGPKQALMSTSTTPAYSMSPAPELRDLRPVSLREIIVAAAARASFLIVCWGHSSFLNAIISVGAVVRSPSWAVHQ